MAANCRAYVQSYLRRGKLQRGPCEIAGCQRPPFIYHRDYSKPLAVTFLCKEHALDQGLVDPSRPKSEAVISE